MARTEIRGGQIKDDSITGDDVDESTLVITTIKDADGDTKIQVEESSDEDKIRLDTAGVERAVIDQNELLLSVPLHVSGTNQEGIRIAKGDNDYRQLVFENDGVDAASFTLSNAENLVIMNETAGKEIQFWVDPADALLNDIQAVTIAEDGTVGIGNTTPVARLEVQEDNTSKATLQLTTDNDNGSASPVLELKRNSNSAAAGDYIGQIKFQGETSSGNNRTYGKITGKITDASAESDTGLLEVAVRNGGSNVITAQFTGELLKLKNSCGIEVDGDTEHKGGIRTAKIVDVNSTYNATTSDYCLRAIHTGNISINLPSKSNNAGQVIIVKDALGNCPGATLRIIPNGSDTIDGLANFQFGSQHQSVTLLCDGINGWMIIGAS